MDKNLPNHLNKYKIKIRKIDLNSNNFRIESDDGKLFITSIKKGSIQCKIFNESNQEVNLCSLEENSLLTIIGSEMKDPKLSDEHTLYNYLINNLENNEPKKNENKEKNIIVIKKIIVKNNYVFNSDSSDEYNQFD
jgi:hypothetical protein